MATLFLDRSGLEIRVIDNAVALYENGVRSTTVPIKLIERLIVQGARTRLDTSVLLKLAEAGTSTLLLAPRAGRRIAIVLGPAHNDAAIRLAQAQRCVDPAFCDQWAQQIVHAKIRRQLTVLETAAQKRPDQRKALFDACRALRDILGQFTPESAQRSSASLRGLEGAAARSYFAGYGALFAPTLEFTGRNRRPPRDPVNACLSLAYTLLHFDAVRAAHVAGLDPLLGFYHRPAFGRESLASDLIEPLRPHVDQWIWQQFIQRDLREEHFSRDKGACLLGKSARGRFYAAWEKFAPTGRRWLRQRCTTLARNLRTEGQTWLVEDDDEVF